MKKFILILFISFWSIGNINAQRVATDDDLRTSAIAYLNYELKGVDSIKVEQFNKLVEIELKIDKEYPYLNPQKIIGGKNFREKIKAILALREKTYPTVLNEKQIKKWKENMKRIYKDYYK